MNERNAKDLLKRFEANQCSAEEEALVNSWYLHSASLEDMPEDAPDYAAVKNNVLKSILGQGRNRVYLPYLRYAAAIIIIAGLGFGARFVLLHFHKEAVLPITAADIKPGGNKATLTLSNGTKINLDQVKAGDLANQGGVTITKNSKGQIVYTITHLSPSGRDGEAREGNPLSSQGGSLPKGERVVYNTITTPNGGQYQVILPDGSLVYLNAASSLKYPVQFDTKQRLVSLVGEGYFEITKNPNQPFIVKTENQSVKVLGTHFNVSCYAKDATITTLAEGKVEVSILSPNDPSKNLSPSEIKTLKPGQQSLLIGNSLKVKDVDIEDAIAWKDGLFVFDRMQLKEVLTQIGRWYNVEVDFTDLPNTLIVADIARTLTLSEVLKTLENTSNLKFHLQGRRLSIEK
jgi:transmembrane sensor